MPKLGILVVLLALASVMAGVNAHPLAFSIYASNSTLLTEYKGYYANATANDILIDDVYTPTVYGFLQNYNKPQIFPRMVLANNYSELTSYELSLAQAFNFSSNDYIGYDAEDWALTPRMEQNNQVKYMQEACNAVHSAGYKFAYTPEIDINGWGAFAEVNWTCVDFVDLQEQFTSSNTTALADNVTQMLAVSKTKNPNLDVFVQLDMNNTLSVLENDITALSQIDGVDGVIIQDLCNATSCNATLTTLVSFTKEINASASQPVPDTTITTTTSTTSSSTTSTTTTFTTTSTSSTTPESTTTTTIMVNATVNDLPTNSTTILPERMFPNHNYRRRFGFWSVGVAIGASVYWLTHNKWFNERTN